MKTSSHAASRTILGIVGLVVAFCFAPNAWAGAPTDQLRDGVRRVFKVLRDPTLKGEEKAADRQAAIRSIAYDIFDFGETAKLSLGQHWEQRTPAEREEFVRLFTDLIQRSYITKVEGYDSDKMAFRGETVAGDNATVRTTLLLNQGNQMPLDYRMHDTSGRWQVYDISIDGVSLIANYRAQFNKVIRTSSYDALVARLKSHQSEFAPAASSGRNSVR